MPSSSGYLSDKIARPVPYSSGVGTMESVSRIKSDDLYKSGPLELRASASSDTLAVKTGGEQTLMSKQEENKHGRSYPDNSTQYYAVASPGTPIHTRKRDSEGSPR